MNKYSNYYIALRMMQRTYLQDGRLFVFIFFHNVDKTFIFEYKNNNLKFHGVMNHAIRLLGCTVNKHKTVSNKRIMNVIYDCIYNNETIITLKNNLTDDDNI